MAYVDPAWIQNNFAAHPTKVIFSHYPDPMDGLPEPDLPEADYVFITHHHQDHVKTSTLNRLTTNKTSIYAPARCAKLIGKEFREVSPGDTFDVGEISVRVVDAYNSSEGRSTRKQHRKGECVGYLITFGEKTIYHAGDTDVIPEMQTLGKVDIAFLPIGGTFTMDAEEASRASSLIQPRIVVPMHYLKAEPGAFEQAVRDETGVSVKILQIGEALTM